MRRVDATLRPGLVAVLGRWLRPPPQNADSRALFFRRSLRARFTADCGMHHCPHGHCLSTGWVMYHPLRDPFDRRDLGVEFDCPRDGPFIASRPEWQELIDELVALEIEAGFDMDAATSAIRQRWCGTR